MEDKVVWVNEKDEKLGLINKIEAHQRGILHRAISVIILNKKGEMLMQQRAAEKYHSPLLWANACCSHPRENENYLNAAKRRLKEEIGIETSLTLLSKFIYKEDVGKGMKEHELDYLFVGLYNGEIYPNAKEVQNYKWVSIEELQHDMQTNTLHFAPWFKHVFNQYLKNKNG